MQTMQAKGVLAMSDQDNLRDAEALGEARRRDKADSDWHAREARLLFIDAARWQRDQLRTDEAIERVARAIHDDECACGDLNNDRYGDDGTLYYLDKARAAIAALLGED